MRYPVGLKRRKWRRKGNAVQAFRPRVLPYAQGVAKPNYIELGDRRNLQQIPILYEDRAILAVDKPPGWLLVPFSWQRTGRNLQAAITSSIAAGDYWARSRNLKFLKFVHRLDGETSGILLFSKSVGGTESFGELFESRRMHKTYLVVVEGVPKQAAWTCHARIAPDPERIGRMKIDEREGKDSATSFKVLKSVDGRSLIEAKPVTGRTHQIRLHMMVAGHPVVGDEHYGPTAGRAVKSRGRMDEMFPLGLRAVRLEYEDPFTRRRIVITAPTEDFVRAFGFAENSKPPTPDQGVRQKPNAKPTDPPASYGFRRTRSSK